MCGARLPVQHYPATAASRATVSVVCLGEALIDLSPPPGDSLLGTNELLVRIGGAPLNVAIHLKRAGVDSCFLGTLSADGFGDRIRALLVREGVDCRPAVRVDAPTRLAIIDHQDNNTPFRFYGDEPADTRLTVEDVNNALTSGLTALYVSSLLMTHRSSASVQEATLRRVLAAGNILIVSDPNPRPSIWSSRAAMVEAVEILLDVSHLTKLSLDDARALGWPVVPERLMAHLKCRTSGDIVITDGENGSWFDDGLAFQHVPASTVAGIDPTGAGDAFFAAVIAGLLQHGQLNRMILRTASDAGAAIAARHGAH